ncbi:MAG: aspartate-alanine antiporter [Verrucomicrobiae bacterium]|nr:aspartate-alanine antiporter [Verrucomicrobiae bacterium]
MIDSFLHWFAETLRQRPELSLFLTLGLGYCLGKLRLGSLRLGEVTGVLIAGVCIGQLGVKISDEVESVFFLLFLFAVGYGVGPQFFRGLRKDGLPQAVLAAVICTCCLLAAWVASKILGLGVGYGAGLFAGASTMTSALGVADATLAQRHIPEALQELYAGQMSVAFSITYLVGTITAVWFLSSMAPKLLGIDLQAEARTLETALGAAESEPGVHSAYHRFATRTYILQNAEFAGVSVGQLEAAFSGHRVFVEAIRHEGRIIDFTADSPLAAGDVLALSSKSAHLIELQPRLGPETDDSELLQFPAITLDVVFTNKRLTGKTLREISQLEDGHITRGVFLKSLTRSSQALPFNATTPIDRGDILQLSGSKRDVERAASFLGYADRPTDTSDMAMMGIFIFAGALLGAVSLNFNHIPLSLSTSGGALLAGLLLGWLRSVHPTFGQVPRPALWVLSNLGLTAFIAVVGITAGPGFLTGVREAGLPLLIAGVFSSIVPLTIGIYFGKYVLRLNPIIILGACAGARTATAALNQLQESSGSKTPAMGYSVPYAIGNLLLTVFGVIIVLLLS